MADWLGAGTAYPVGDGWYEQFISPKLTVSPVVTTGSLVGHQSGLFHSPQATIQINNQLGTLIGHQSGLFLSPQLSIESLVSTGVLIGHQTGYFVSPSLLVQPIVSSGNLVGHQSGLFLSPKLTIQPIITIGTLEYIIALIEGIELNSKITMNIFQDSIVINDIYLLSRIKNEINLYSVVGLERNDDEL